MSGHLHLGEEVKCMESVGAQDGTDLMAILEKCVFACLAGPQREISTPATTSEA